MRKIYLLCLIMLYAMAGKAQVIITSLNTTYNQNFDSMANTGVTGTAMPAGWLFSETGTNANTSYGIDDGTSNSGNTYSYGSIGSTDRALGGLLSGSVAPALGALFVNTSGTTITSVTISYYGEKWRLGVLNRPDSLIFQYSLTATSITTGTYVTVNSLSYGTAAVTGTVGALNGNLATNRSNIVYTITGLSIPNNGTFFFRWNDYNASGADDGLAIDDVSITFNGTVQPPCTAPVAQPGSLSFSNITTNSFNVVFTAASSAPDEYLAVVSTSATLGAVPVNGTAYNTDDAIGNGIVAYRGSGTSFSETNLTPGTPYYLFVFSLNSNCSNGPVYLATNPATGSQATVPLSVCAAPVGQVNNVVFSSITGNSINGSFTEVADADGYLVIRSTSSNSGFTPVNGTSYPVGSATGNGTVVKYGGGNTFSATGLATATTYYFTFYTLNGFNCTGGPAYNSNPFTTSVATNTNTSGIPQGYYDTVTTQTCAILKSALKWRTVTGYTPRTYGELWTQYGVSDVKPREVGTGSATVIWDIYSDNPTGTDPYNFTPGPVSSGGQQDNGANTSSEGVYYNREHSVPLSWFKGSTGNPGPATDYMHLFPTDKWVNAQRSNYIYGEVTSPGFTSLNGSKLGPNAFAGLTGTAFEPINEYKGDLARAFLYFITRYQDNMAEFLTNNTSTEVQQAFEPNTFPSADTPYLRLMLKWNAQDPVSQKEIDRNNAAFTYQGNRNPFIDHPEYVERIWNSGCYGALPVYIVSFKGTLLGNHVLLNWEVKNESNLLRYEVERSDNNRNFTTAGSVKATRSAAYQYEDNVSNLTGRRLYYRLKRVDADGKFVYSDVFTVHVPLSRQLNVYPNPVTGGVLNVQFAKPAGTNACLQLTDMAGRLYRQAPVGTGTTASTLNVKALVPGVYLLRLVQQSGNTIVQKVYIR